MEDSHDRHQNTTVHGLSLLRGIAALMVCFFHVKKYIWKDACPDLFTSICQQGYLGVHIFFVISGFVIPYSMYIKQYSPNKFFRFLAKRTVRIEPPYVIFVLFMFVWTYAMYQWKGWGQPYLFDLRQFIFNITYLAPFFNIKWISIVFWTLAIEFQFYILTGLVYQMMMKNKIYRYIIMSALIALGFLIPEKYNTIFNVYVFFCIGFQSFLFYAKQINKREYILTTVLFLLFIYFTKYNIAIPFVLITLAGIHFINRENRISTFFGNISYSLYLTHGIAGGAAALFTIGKFTDSNRFILAIIVSIAFATIYYLLVERLFLHLSKKIKY